MAPNQCNSHKNPTIILRELEKFANIHTEAQKTPNGQSNPEQRRAMLEVSQYQTSNYTTEP
jgi:hypothetical protein